jgi:CelD/BcsL family acetyltransferase involved in cellulose biosynthesis
MSIAGTISGSRDRRARGAQAASRGLRASVVQTGAALEVLAHRWLELETRSTGLGMFQSLGWVKAVFAFEAARDNRDFDPVIAVAEDDRRLVAVLPLERIRTGKRSLLVPLGHAFAQVSDVLIDADTDAGEAVSRLLHAALAAAPADGVSLLKVRDESALAHGMPRTCIQTGEAQGAPYVALDEYADFASYFSSIRAKTRKNMRNARNRLVRSGPVTLRRLDRPEDQRALIARTLEGRADRLSEQGLTSRAFREGGFGDFCTSLVGRDDIDIRAFALLHDDQPLAEQWGFVHGDRYYAYVASRDFSHSDESPGRLQLNDIIRACAEEGLKGCDLGVPAMPYKLTFATQTVMVRDYALPATPRGWVMFKLWDVWLRPAVKKLVLALPTRLRSHLMRLAGHGH